MRAPIGIRIRSRRRALALSQAELARRTGISASYLNLIEGNKRVVGGSLLLRIAEQLAISIGELNGEAEHRLLADLDEAFADPLLENLRPGAEAIRQLVAEQPLAGAAMTRLHRAYRGALADAQDLTQRLRSDPLLSQLLHQMLTGITIVRSSAEILEEVTDLHEEERRRFVETITQEARSLSEVARNLLGHFDSVSEKRRAVSPARELNDLIYDHDNYFPALEAAASGLREDVERDGPFGEPALVQAMDRRFGVAVAQSPTQEVDALGFPGQYHFNADARIMWFQTGASAATRQFQLARLYGELAVDELIREEVQSPLLETSTARRLAYRALSSYLAAAMVFPYDQFLEAAEASRYDIDFLGRAFTASFEQVAHRLVTLRRPGKAGIRFGFLRSDPAGRLTKHFPLPGLPLPNSGHACPRWAIYEAFRTPDSLVRQAVAFPDGSRYLFLARTTGRRGVSYLDRTVSASVMLAFDVLEADRTVYGIGLDLTDQVADRPVGPACRLCIRRDCADRQEEVLVPGGGQAAIRAPLVPRSF